MLALLFWRAALRTDRSRSRCGSYMEQDGALIDAMKMGIGSDGALSRESAAMNMAWTASMSATMVRALA